MKANTDDAPVKTEVVYRVRITKIVRNFPFRNHEYKEIGTKDDGESDYGYVYFDDSKNVETDIYEQVVEDIEIPDVIKAVNGMEG